MGVLGSMYAQLPGMGTVVETFENAYSWGPYPRYYTNAWIDSTTADAANTPTFDIRAGLVMGKVTATGRYKQYSPSAADGSEVASAVLVQSLRMQDIFSGSNKDRFYALMVGGGVQSSRLIGLDGMARAQMGDHFFFDDDLPGAHVFPLRRFQTKTANYQIVAADNFSGFDNTGAGGEVDFTLPPIANGYLFEFRAVAAQTLKVVSSEGSNIVALNNASASSLAFSTGSQIVGGGLRVYSNELGTKWFVDNASAGTNAITVA